MPPPSLLLHGFLGRGADWAPVADGLAATRRVLVPDWLDAPLADVHTLPAVQDDAEPADVANPRAGGLAWTADRLADQLDSDGIDRADVVGYSMGGRLALLFAIRHPERVRRLVLVSASPGLKTPAARASRRVHDAVLARDLTSDLPGFLARWTRQPVFASLSDAQRATIEADRLAHVEPARAAHALVAMGTGAMPSLWEPLRSLRVETYAIAGDRDPAYAALAREMADLGVRATLLPDAGHALLTEAPRALSALLTLLLA